jgi:hypothetical protein
MNCCIHNAPFSPILHNWLKVFLVTWAKLESQLPRVAGESVVGSAEVATMVGGRLVAEVEATWEGMRGEAVTLNPRWGKSRKVGRGSLRVGILIV